MTQELLKAMKVPLAVRYLLNQAGHCTTDQQQHITGHSVSIQRQLLTEGEEAHGSAEGEITLVSSVCSCTDSADDASLKKFTESGERERSGTGVPCCPRGE
jgi:hypothetical protein